MVIQFAKAQALDANGTAQTGTDGTPNIAGLGSPQLGNPRQLTVAFTFDQAATIAVNVSYDGSTWLPANIRNSEDAAAVTLTGSGGATLDINPAPYVQVSTDSDGTLSAWAYTA